MSEQKPERRTARKKAVRGLNQLAFDCEEEPVKALPTNDEVVGLYERLAASRPACGALGPSGNEGGARQGEREGKKNRRKEREREREREKERKRKREIEKDRKRDRKIDTERERYRKIEREIER